MTINAILTPLAYDKFVKEYWEIQPLHIERADSGHFDSLLSGEKIVQLVQNGEAYFPDVQAINASSAVSVADYTIDKKLICPEKIMQCYSQGATIVVSEAHKKFQPLQILCARFSRDFQMLCQANVYLSPAGNQGFHSHYDTHDVFVLQLAGRKKFRFYNTGIKLPFTDDTYTPDSNNDSQIVDEVDISAGDTLYIPRGIVHDAIADKGEPSLHITLGAFPFVLRDLMQEMIQVAAEGDVEWRSAIDLQQPIDLTELYKKAENLFSEPVYLEALSRLADEIALQQPSESIVVPEVSLQSQISVQDSSIYGIEKRQDQLKLRLRGVVLTFEAPMSNAVDAIIGNGIKKVGDIPALDNEQKLALCRQLIGAGAIMVDGNHV